MNLPLITEMVEKFQCPGCMLGYNTKCSKFELDETPDGTRCLSHVAGTLLIGVGHFNLGLPKGFNKVRKTEHFKTNIRLHESPEECKHLWDRLNVPIWALVEDGYLFVRTYSPRIDYTYVDVVKGGTMDMFGNTPVIDVSDFINEID